MTHPHWWHPDIFMAKRAYLEGRMKLIQAVRAYFDQAGFLEIESPILQVMPCADAHIHGFKTALKGLDLSVEKELYLHTSPEFEMKKLLVAGLPKIYQICHVFRNGEGSKRHSPEFTMIEWYRSHAGYEEIMDDCMGLFRFCADRLGITHYEFAGHKCDPFAQWEKITVADAFQKYAGIDLRSHMDDTNAFRKAAQDSGVAVRDQDRWDEIFFTVMDAKIEPFLGFDAPAVIYDYPASMAALSRKSEDDPRFAKRFELYICGLELANAFDELTDAKEQRIRFQADMDEKFELYGERYPLDEDFLAALEFGMPPAGGIALGIDRLAMCATGASDIDQVLWCGKP